MLGIVNATGRSGLAYTTALRLQSLGIPVQTTDFQNAPQRSEMSYIRYNPVIIETDDTMLQAISVLFYGEKRPATNEELSTMTAPYELILGADWKQ